MIGRVFLFVRRGRGVSDSHARAGLLCHLTNTMLLIRTSYIVNPIRCLDEAAGPQCLYQPQSIECNVIPRVSWQVHTWKPYASYENVHPVTCSKVHHCARWRRRRSVQAMWSAKGD
jgi:hypothetical protein